MQCTVCFHVDDVMVTSEDESMLDVFEEVTKRKYENVSVTRGSRHSYLGRLFDFCGDFKCKVSMTGYIDRLIGEEGIEGRAVSPATDMLFKIDPDAEKLGAAEKKRFYSTVQRLLYLSVQFRRDITLAIAFLTTRVREPDVDDRKKLLRVLMYLNATKDLCLVFAGDGSKIVVLRISIDAAFALHWDGKSHSGYVAIIGGGSVEAKSKKQSLVTKSSTEAEMVALSDMSSLAIWLREFLIGQGYEMERIVIEQDNKSCIQLIETGRTVNPNSRHINNKYFFIKDRIKMGELRLEYTPTEELVADVLTKPVQGDRFRFLRTKLMNHSL